MSWVGCDPAILPGPHGIGATTSTEGQFLYVKYYKDKETNWWTGILRVWEVTRLTDSKFRGALLELSHPPTPRTWALAAQDIQEDSDADSEEENMEREVHEQRSFNPWKPEEDEEEG